MNIKRYSLHSLLITAASLTGTAFGFLNHLLFARVFGVGSEFDQFLLAISVPVFVAAIIASYFIYGIVPILIQAEDANKSTSAAFLLSCLFGIPFFLIGSIIYIWPTELLLPCVLDRCVKVELVAMAWIFGGVQVLGGGLSAIFNAQQKYFLPIILSYLTPICSGALILITLQNPTINILIIGMLIGSISSTILGIYVQRSIFRNIKYVSINDLIFILKGNTGFITTILVSIAFSIITVIDAYWAPRFGEGTLSTLGYIQRIIIGFGNLAVIGIFLTSGPQFANILIEQGDQKFYQAVQLSLIKVIFVAIIISILIYINSNSLIELIFGDKLTVDNKAKFNKLLPLMLPGMIAMLCCAVALRALLCLKNIRISSLIFGGGVPVVYFICCWFYKSIGYLSMGISYTLAWIFGSIILISSLKFKYSSSYQKKFQIKT
jgi:putative peptidoglycan lipid II flippase